MTDTDTIELLVDELTMVSLDRIVPHPANPNQADEDALSSSLETHGYVVPMIVQAPRGRRKRFRLIDGEHRWRRLKADGIVEAKVLVLDVDDNEALSLLATINPLARAGQDDPTKVLGLLQQVLDQPLGLRGTGYVQADVDALLANALAASKIDLDDDDDTFRRGLRERANDYEGAATRQMILPLARTQFEWAIGCLDDLREQLDVDTNSEVVLVLIAQAFGTEVPE